MAHEQLRVTDGEEGGRRLSVDGELLIGRGAPGDDGRLGQDPELSRLHARLTRDAEGRLTIEDLGSANGTFLNDEPIDTPRILAAGDVVRMGRTVLQVTDSAGAVPEPPSASPAPVPELVITAGSSAGRRLTLGEELILGREGSGDGELSDDRELSRRHARVAGDPDGRLTIEDLGSANGTFVNGDRVYGRQLLELGDTVRIGSTTMQLVEAGQAPAPAVAPPAPSAPAPPPPVLPPRPPTPAVDLERLASQLPPGSVFAGCRVEQVIGHGDMGVVYRAEELALERRVALKLILPEHSGQERFRERFQREAAVAAAIDHPNVIPIFDAGDEGGVLYITMRLVDGTDLRALIAGEGRIEPLRAARIVRQVAAALDAAHARGMIHRDVKPSNVLLGREDHVYLSDFGLAKRVASVAELTRHGSMVARAEYVAPEQILNQRVDARADIYALGCLLFEALTGETPFARWSGGPEALAHLEAPRPSAVALCPDLPPEFDDVLQRAMAIEPGDRYPSAGDFGQAALVAAGGLRQARSWSVVATGEAAFAAEERAAEEAVAAAPPAAASPGTVNNRLDVTRWAIAIAGLVIVAVFMVAALNGISNL